MRCALPPALHHRPQLPCPEVASALRDASIGLAAQQHDLDTDLGGYNSHLVCWCIRENRKKHSNSLDTEFCLEGGGRIHVFENLDDGSLSLQPPSKLKTVGTEQLSNTNGGFHQNHN